MDLHQKIRTLPTSPGVYLYKNAEGQVIYVGKAKNLRSRVRSYFLEGDAGRTPRPARCCARRSISTTSWSTTRKKRWRSRTT